MPSLQDVLGGVPFLSGYQQQEAINQQKGAQQLQQVGQVMGIQQAMQQQAKRDVDAQSEVKMRAALQGLPQDATEEQVISALRPFASADVMLKLTQGSLDRLDARNNRPDNSPETVKLANLLQTLPEGDPRREFITNRLDVLGRPERPVQPSTIGRMLQERDALPAGHPNRAIYDKAITEFKSGNGSNVTFSPTLQLGKEASNKVDTGLLDTTKGVMTLSTIESQFKPEYQTVMPRLSAEWSSIKEKFGANLGTQDRAFLTEFSQYKRNAINTMSEYIKSITGAAMSDTEASRILQGMPKVGEGIADGDSPTQFKAKLDDAMKQTKMSLARYEYIKRNGIALSRADGEPTVPLSKMPEIMNGRGRLLESQIKQANPRLNPEQVSQQVRQILAKEFGLVQ